MNTLYEVTAIIPAYNAENYVEEAILSVLGQTEKCKLIVVDDASKDGTLSIAKKYNAEYPDQIQIIEKTQNEGVSAARNDAVRMADTDFVAFLDADDWWSQDKIELQLALVREKGVLACYSGRELMNEDGASSQKIVRVPESISYKELLKGNVIPCSSVLIKRDVALQYPMEHDELHEDYITWLMMLKNNVSFVGIDKPLLKSRLSDDGKSRNKWKSAIMTYKVYRHIGISMPKAVWCFIHYAWNGFKKYF